MAVPKAVKDRLTFDMPPDLRAMLDRFAADQGWSAGECVRRILAEKFAQLREGETTP